MGRIDNMNTLMPQPTADTALIRHGEVHGNTPHITPGTVVIEERNDLLPRREIEDNQAGGRGLLESANAPAVGTRDRAGTVLIGSDTRQSRGREDRIEEGVGSGAEVVNRSAVGSLAMSPGSPFFPIPQSSHYSQGRVWRRRRKAGGKHRDTE
jgi:hypothetical protein